MTGSSSFLTEFAAHPELFAESVAKLWEGFGRALSIYARSKEAQDSAASSAAPNAEMTQQIGEVTKTLSYVVSYWMANPERALDAQKTLWHSYTDLWTRTLSRMMGVPTPALVNPDPKDRRFKDAEWNENYFFDFIKQLYLVTANWAEAMVEQAEDLDPHTRHKAQFYMKQIVNALAPSNFLLTNPEVLRRTFESKGENLLKGMVLLAEDFAAGKGTLKIRQSDPKSFILGENIAITAGKVIAENDLCQVLMYAPCTEKVLKRPLLIIPPWINKYYILDLNPEKSFIRWAVEQGHTVFTLSWVNATAAHATKSFEDYMREGIFHTLDLIETITEQKGEINALGYCIGGTLLASALAFMAAEKDTRIASATFLTTQTDFTHAGDLKVFIDSEQLAALEKKMARTGYLDGLNMATTFNMLRSNDLIWPYVINTYMKGEEPFPFDLLYWNSDSTRIPATAHSFYLRNFYLENQLAHGEMVLGGHRLCLRDISLPSYHLATREDHIAPAVSVYESARLLKDQVTYVLSASGHIAGVVNPPSQGKYSYRTGPAPQELPFEEWIKTSVETSGSWWPHWDSWIKSLEDSYVPARSPLTAPTILEDAPGSYVREKA